MSVETCEVVVGQSPQMTPVVCGEPGVRMGAVVKCRKHWAASRRRADKIAKRVRES